MKGRARTAILLTVFLDLLGFGIVIPILPLYASEIANHPSAWMEGANRALGLAQPGAFWAGTTMVGFSLMQFVAAPLLGRLSDRVGRRPVLWVSLLGTSAGLVILGLTQRFEWVLAARLLDGITGGNIPVAQAAMADITPPAERSKAMGMIGAAFGLGFVFGPAFAGLLSGTRLGVHLPFLVAAALSLVASILVVAWLPETLPREHRDRAARDDSRGHALLDALRTDGLRSVLAIAFLAMCGFAMMESTFSLLVHARFGFDQRAVGYLFGFVGVLIVLYQAGLVRLVAKRMPERVALAAGLVLMATALYLLPTTPWKWPFLLLMAPLAWGSGMNGTATQALASRLAGPERQGSTLGALGAVQGLGRIAGPAIATFAFARFGPASPYHLAAAAVACAFVLSLVLHRPERAPAAR
jgi:DHA1 family tetracycline resistance protein-like MFS transporter